MSLINITMTFDSLDEVQAFFAARGNQTPADAVAEAGKEPTKPRGKNKTAESSTTSSADSSAPSTKETASEKPAAETAEKPADTAPQLSYAEDIQKPVMELVKLGQQDKIQEILKELGITSLKGSDPAIWPAAKQKLDAALVAAKAGGELA